MTKSNNPMLKNDNPDVQYQAIFGDVSRIVDAARQSAARSVNAVMTAAYWLVGRYIVEFEQAGEERAEYRAALIERLASDLTKRFGRGFSRQNIWQMRLFYQTYGPERILQTPSGELPEPPTRRPILQSASGESGMISASQTSGAVSAEMSLTSVASRFPLPWSAYVRLLSVKNMRAREFYETEALRGGWSVRQLDRQINSQFYERTVLSKKKATMLTKGRKARPEDRVLPEEEIKDPFVLEFLNLKDEYSENDLEEALIRRLENFLLELGGDFCFMGRQRRLRIGDQWYRVDLLFFHRRLRCLVVIDLKIGGFTHADAGQMHLYLNYAREHWVQEGENPPVGLILCAQKDEAVVRYALEGLANKVLAAEYRTTLPDEELLASEIDRAREALNTRGLLSNKAVLGSQDRNLSGKLK
ncbi:MAG: PDDEXK nuclease domain-containing protein [Rhodospirillaceae bacterium]|nr:PDDEXK nuclease domain-containing protein [Rhodospirillaceae bacterium]MDD9996917.1 PDDEXK nuclease domain-containing protein [Rhodospirillaceae bacterium]